jgi:hypothetical protein
LPKTPQDRGDGPFPLDPDDRVETVARGDGTEPAPKRTPRLAAVSASSIATTTFLFGRSANRRAGWRRPRAVDNGRRRRRDGALFTHRGGRPPSLRWATAGVTGKIVWHLGQRTFAPTPGIFDSSILGFTPQEEQANDHTPSEHRAIISILEIV